MKDEIKEILYDLKNTAKKHTIQILENGGKIEHCPQEIETELRLNTYSANILLDYITNLQEELEDLRESDWAWHQTLKTENKREYRSKFLKEFQQEYDTNTFPDYDEIYKRYDKLKKENKRLKGEIKTLENNCQQAENSCRQHRLANKNHIRRLKRREKQINLYKSRNEKAIELLKEAGCYDEETKTFCDDVWEELPKLLNILNGGDKDVKN